MSRHSVLMLLVAAAACAACFPGVAHAAPGEDGRVTGAKRHEQREWKMGAEQRRRQQLRLSSCFPLVAPGVVWYHRHQAPKHMASTSGLP